MHTYTCIHMSYYVCELQCVGTHGGSGYPGLEVPKGIKGFSPFLRVPSSRLAHRALPGAAHFWPESAGAPAKSPLRIGSRTPATGGVTQHRSQITTRH